MTSHTEIDNKAGLGAPKINKKDHASGNRGKQRKRVEADDT